MAELAEAFEQHLRSLSDDEWNALASRVRTPKTPPAPPPLAGERRDEPSGNQPKFANSGLEEAYRRGFIDADGKPVRR
ncbi:hypothetical protein FIV07_12210 [Mycobacterium sp. THAF192]|nr:hypothetical protein FIV07_12210 [Mycobacterium sp. THAF192]